MTESVIDRIIVMRKEGHSYGEIEKATGVTKSVIAKRCREAGLGGIAKEQKINFNLVKKNVEKVGFLYVEGFKNTKSNITVRCTKCGKCFKIYYHTIAEYLTGAYNRKTVGCKECRKEELKRQKEIKEAAKLSLQQEKKDERSRKKLESENARYEWLFGPKTCRNCMKEYTITDSGYHSKTFCSFKCQNRWNNRAKIDKRLNQIKSRPTDRDITLEKLFKRDCGKCYICGKMCDYSDYTKDKYGTIIAGKMYPSIDHVIPLSKGGTHTWDNIKLACRGCNTIKRDR